MTLLVYENDSIRKANLKDLLEIVKALLLLIPMGKVTTYGDLASILNTSPRIVGKLMSLNDQIIIVPCHRVVKSNGFLGGYSMANGVEFKRKLLEFEGVKFDDKNRVSKESLRKSLFLVLG